MYLKGINFIEFIDNDTYIICRLIKRDRVSSTAETNFFIFTKRLYQSTSESTEGNRKNYSKITIECFLFPFSFSSLLFQFLSLS